MDTSRPRGRDSTLSSNDRPHSTRAPSLPPLYPDDAPPTRENVSDDDDSDTDQSGNNLSDQDYSGRGRRAVEKPPYLPHQIARQIQQSHAIHADDTPYNPSPVTQAPLPHERQPGQPSSHQKAASSYSNMPQGVSRDRPEVAPEHDRPQKSNGAHDGDEESRSRSRESGGGRNGSSVSMSGSDGQEGGRPLSSGATTGPSHQKGEAQRPPQDEPYDPPPVQPASAQHTVHPPYRYNQERYPAYDANARRIGLDHVRYDNAGMGQEGNGTRAYYRPRTHNYPAPNASMKDLPHVMTMTLDIRPDRLGPTPHAAPPPHEIDMAPNSPGASHSSAASILQEELDLGRTDRRVTTGRPPAQALVPRDSADGTPHLREMLGLGPSDTVDLSSLSDPPPGAKPSYPYPVLIQLAINGSPRKRLTLSEIYSAIEERFEWFKNTDDKAWQGSIRHTLSLKSCFRTISRPITEPGKGNYWIVDFSMGDGNKRPRKRNPRPKKAERPRITAETPTRQHDEDESSEDTSMGDVDDRPHISRRSTREEEEDGNIDPQLRGQGHSVGDGRMHVSVGSAARRAARRGQSPYSTPSPTASQGNRNPRPYGSSSSVPTMVPVTTWSSNRPSSRASNRSSYEPPPPPPSHPGYGQSSFSSTRSTLHPSRDTTPRSPPPHPSSSSAPSSSSGPSKAAPSNWAPYGVYSSLSSSTSVPSISSTTRHSYSHNSHPQTLTSLSGSTRTYMPTHPYPSEPRQSSSHSHPQGHNHDYDHHYARPHYPSSRSMDSREPSEPPRRTTTSSLNRSPDWNAAVPRRTVYQHYSESSDSSDAD